MRALVTGGAGFIGSTFVGHLLAAGAELVTVYDALTYRGLRENLVRYDGDPRYAFVHGDIADAGTLDRVLPEHDVVVNFANGSFVDRSILRPGEFVQTNVVGTAALVDAVRRHATARLVHVSTDEVYGSIERGRFREDHPLDPSSPYSATKAAGDLYARAAWKTWGTPVVVTRSCNVFGPYQFPENFLPLFITNLLDGKSVPLYGDGLNVREWIHVDDVCAAIALVLEKGALGEVYNIGSGVEWTNADLARELVRRIGADESLIEHVEDRPGHDRRYALEWERVRALGWKPARAFSDALDETITWYRDNRAWWEPLRARFARG